MTTKRVRNALNANGALEILDDGTLQFADKTNSAYKAVMPSLTASTSLATGQNAQDANASKPSYAFQRGTQTIQLVVGSAFSSASHGLYMSGTAPITIMQTFKSLSSDGTTQLLIQNLNTADINNGYGVMLNNGYVQGYQNYNNAYVRSVKAAYSVNAWNSYAYVSDGSAAQMYLNGVLATVAATGGSLASGVSVGARPDGSFSLTGQIARTLVFNYAITDLAKIQRYSCGCKLDFDDIGGCMTSLASGTVGTSVGANVTTASFLVIGRRYSITLTAIVSSYVTIWYTDGTTTTNIVTDQQVLVGAPITLQITPTDATKLKLKFQNHFNGENFTFAVNQFGAVLDLEPENIYSDKWIDASTNGLHGTVTNAVVMNKPIGLPLGRVDGGAIPAGYIGETIASTVLTTSVSLAGSSFAGTALRSITLTPGTYLVTARLIPPGVTGAIGRLRGYLTYYSGTGTTYGFDGDSWISNAGVTETFALCGVVVISTAAVLYLTIDSLSGSLSGGPYTVTSALNCTRIA